MTNQQTMDHGRGCELYLNNDIIIEILRCLPLKSQVRFKSVNRTWYDIINSRYFAGRYRDKNYKNWGLLIQQSTTLIGGPKLNKECLSIASPEYCNGVISLVKGGFRQLMLRYFKHTAPGIAGPLDGLICIYEEAFQCLVSWRKTTIALCNPYLGGRVEIIPPPPLSSAPPQSIKARCHLGFGYDSATRDYKIVMVLSYNDNNNNARQRYIIEVYSRATNSWKELDCNVLSSRGDIYFTRPIMPFQDGSFAHWRAWVRQSDGLYDNVVLSFDMRNEVFEVTPLPPCLPEVRRARAVRTYRLWEFGVHSTEDSLFIDYCPCASDNRWFVDRWKLKKLGGGGTADQCWEPLIPRVEIESSSPREGKPMGNEHGVMHQYTYPTNDYVKFHYISPTRGTVVTMEVPRRNLNGQMRNGWVYVLKYQPSLIELNADRQLPAPVSTDRYVSRACSSFVCDVGLTIVAIGASFAVHGAVVAAIRTCRNWFRTRRRL